MDLESLWNQILEVVQERVNGQSYRTWISPTRLLRIEDDTLYVEGPNQFFLDWVSQHHLQSLLSGAAKVMGGEPGIKFVVSDPSGKAPPADEERRRQSGSFLRRHTQVVKSGVALNDNYSFEEFVVGANNRMAHAASLAVAEKPGRVYNPLFIYGGVGLGKTHLAQAIAHFVLQEKRRSKVFYATTETFVNELIFSIRQGKTLEFKNKYRSVDLLIVDDVQFLAGKESTQEEFFHTFNALYDADKQIVVTSDRPPKEIRTLEERLVSRFEWGLITDIQMPDLETRMAILRKKTEKDDLNIPDDVLFLIAENVRNNIRELEGSLIRLLAFAGLTGTPITLDLAGEVLKDMIKARPRVPSVGDIQKRVADRYGISVEQMKSEKRSSHIVLPRQVAIHLCREITDKSLVQIGREFGGRDHTTVIHACRKISRLIKEEGDLRRTVMELHQALSLAH